MFLKQHFIRSAVLAAGATMMLGAAATTASAQDFTMKIGLGTFKDV